MGDTTSESASKRINVLTLDGGGVRGLSSLLILQELMRCINDGIKSQLPTDEAHEDLQPHHIFNLVAGTSTGGLIAIMLGKLGMSVEECILAYEYLASHIFGKKHLRSRFTGGLAPAKYSGSRMMARVRTLIRERGFSENLEMHLPSHQDTIACAVICREHENESRYSDFLPEAVCICSLRCPKQVDCLVCEAARATSAAPTFFPVQTIGARHFADGGMEFNNPSYEIWRHYSQSISVAETRRRSAATDIELDNSPDHPGGLNFSEVRFINLGTGDRPHISKHQSKSSKFAILIPAPIRMGLSLKRKLTKMAVNSELIAENMRGLAQVAGGRFSIEYKRFSADNGVCFIKMDKYGKIPDIRRLTEEYLATAQVQRRLKRLGNEIARDYLAKHRPTKVRDGPSLLTVPHNTLSRPQTPESRILRSVPNNASQQNAGPPQDPENSHDNSPTSQSSTGTSSPGIGPSAISSPTQHISDLPAPTTMRTGDIQDSSASIASGTSLTVAA